MRAIIVIIIVAIVVYGIYRMERKDETGSGGAGCGDVQEHHGDQHEPRPDDQDHETERKE